MMHPLARDAASARLTDYLDGIGECIRAAVDRYNDARLSIGVLCSRAQANVVHDYARQHAQMLFADDERMKVRVVDELLILELDGEILIRIQKLAGREGWAFSSNSTEQTRRWDAQMPIEGLQTTNLTLGYRLDLTERRLEVVALVCRLNRRYQWHLELAAPGSVVHLPPTLDDDIAEADFTLDEEGAADENSGNA